MIACGPLLGLLQAASPGLALLKGRTPCWQSLESGAINAVVFTEYTLYGSLQELSRDRVFPGCIASSYLSSQGHHCTRCKLHLKLRQAMRCLGARVTKLNVYDSITSQTRVLCMKGWIHSTTLYSAVPSTSLFRMNILTVSTNYFIILYVYYSLLP
jgi:hypothetical protein